MIEIGSMIHSDIDFSKIEGARKKILEDQEIQLFIKSNKIPGNVVDTYLSKFLEFIQQRDNPSKEIGRRPVLQYFGGYISVAYEINQDELKRMRDGIRQDLITDKTTKQFTENTLQDIIPDEFNTNIIKAFVNLINKYQYKEQAKGVWLCGTYGVGKTHLMGAVARGFYKKGCNVMFVSSSDFLNSLKDLFEDKQQYRQLFEKAKKAEILIIDDIGAESTGAWGYKTVLYEILHLRMLGKKLTFFTSNLSQEEFKQSIQETLKSKIDADRFHDRVTILAKEVTLSGPNRRAKA